MTDTDNSTETFLVPVWVTPPFDKKRKYKIRGLDGFESAEFSQSVKVNLETREVTVIVAAAKFACSVAVSDWEGVEDKSGTIIPFSVDALMKQPDAQTVQWLVGQITGRSHMSPDAEKNSSSRSKSRTPARNSTARLAPGGATKRATSAPRKTPRRKRSG